MSNDDFVTGEPPAQGMSTGMKVLLFGGGGCALVVVLCCGFFGIFGAWMVNMIQGAVSDDPVVIREVTAELTEIAIPNDFRPMGSLRLENPFGDDKIMFVSYEKDDDSAFLVLAHLGPIEIDAEEVANEIENQIAQQRAMNPEFEMRTDEGFVVDETEKRDFVINGEPATFVFSRGHSEDSGDAAMQVAGSFEGQVGTVLFMLFAKEDAMDEEQVVEIIESIQ